MALLEIQQIIQLADDIASRLVPPINFSGLSTRFSTDEGHGLEIDWAYHWIFVERGQEVSRRSTLDVDELLYWMFRGAVERRAIGDAAKSTCGDRGDVRRLIFNQTADALGVLNPHWRHRYESEIEGILRDHPYRD